MLYAFRIQYAMLCHATPCHAAAQILCLWSSMQPAHLRLPSSPVPGRHLPFVAPGTYLSTK